MPPKNALKLIVLPFCAVAWLATVAGCVHRPPAVVFSQAMRHGNPIGKVAVFGDGNVVFPGLGDGEGHLGLAESERALEYTLAETRRVLLQKGYEVVFCEPALIGNHSPPDVIDNRLDGDVSHWKNTGGGPAYVFPALQKDENLKNAVINVFQSTSLSAESSQEDLAALRSATGADTFCFCSVTGRTYTFRRHMASALVNLVARGPADSHSSYTEGVKISFTFIDARTGESLWRFGLTEKGEPYSPHLRLINDILGYLPKVGDRMSSRFTSTPMRHPRQGGKR